MLGLQKYKKMYVFVFLYTNFWVYAVIVYNERNQTFGGEGNETYD